MPLTPLAIVGGSFLLTLAVCVESSAGGSLFSPSSSLAIEEQKAPQDNQQQLEQQTSDNNNSNKGLTKLVLEWQLDKAIERVLDELRALHTRPLATDGSNQLQQPGDPQVSSPFQHLSQPFKNQAQLEFETIPRPVLRQVRDPAAGAERERRMSALTTRNPLMTAQLTALDQLNAIESLNSLLDDGDPSRPGRAYKPRIMSTARGFGKRSNV